MKKLFTLFTFTLFAYTNLSSQCGNLYIGGVIDGPLSGGTPKGIQVCASGDVLDLSIYGLGTANNGGGTDGQEFTFPPLSILAGQCFWVGSATANWDAFFGFTPCYTGSFVFINGDDAIELFCNGNLEDLLGDQDTDGTGECWESLDGWAVNNNAAPNFGSFDCNDYTFSGPNALDGETSNSTAATPYPSPEQVCPSALPVTIASFSAKNIGTYTEISWQTHSEINNEKFEIQRSQNGKKFTTIGEVRGGGTSTHLNEYIYIDQQPQMGLNYYRLKQIDYDGRYDFSDVAMIENKVSRISVFPTYTDGQVNIMMSDTQDLNIDIYNNAGQLMINQSISNDAILDISSLPQGIYIVKVEGLNFIETKRIIKR